MSDIGKCVLCNNLEGKNFYVDDKLVEGCNCTKGKFVIDGVEHYFTVASVSKDIKALKEIEDGCECWDYRLKGKSS